MLTKLHENKGKVTYFLKCKHIVLIRQNKNKQQLCFSIKHT